MQKTAENGRLSPRQEGCIAALLAEPNIRAAATVSKIAERTIYKWLKDDAFCTAYREARREAVSRAIGAIQQAAVDAVQTLKDVMTDATAPAPARVSAAKSVLELAVKGVETDDVDARLSALEHHLASRPGTQQ